MTARVLLDTLVFIRALKAPELLSRKATSALYDPDVVCEISASSLSEIAIKHSVGKLDIDHEATRQGINDLQLRVLSWKADHAIRLFHLPRHHSDPFDRQLIAQALEEDIPVVTCDNRFRLYRGIKVIW